MIYQLFQVMSIAMTVHLWLDSTIHLYKSWKQPKDSEIASSMGNPMNQRAVPGTRQYFYGLLWASDQFSDKKTSLFDFVEGEPSHKTQKRCK